MLLAQVVMLLVMDVLLQDQLVVLPVLMDIGITVVVPNVMPPVI